MNGLKEVTLQTVGGGVAAELFAREFDRVLKNIEDVNTDPEKTRKVTLEFRISPTENRDMAMITIEASSRVAGVKPASSAVYLGRNAGKSVALLNDPKQVEMAFPQKPPIAIAGMAPGEVPLDA